MLCCGQYHSCLQAYRCVLRFAVRSTIQFLVSSRSTPDPNMKYMGMGKPEEDIQVCVCVCVCV